MDSTVAVAIVGLISTGLTHILTGKYVTEAERSKSAAEIARLEVERDQERERSFEKAQVGYRMLYRKFLKHAEEAAEQGPKSGAVSALEDDYREALIVGFKPVRDAMDVFWPEEDRRAHRPPDLDRLGPLIDAMARHGRMRLDEFDALEWPSDAGPGIGTNPSPTGA